MINRKYLERIEPENLVEHINNFEDWVDSAESKQDLICTLERFEKAGLYEQCIIIKNRIDDYESRNIL